MSLWQAVLVFLLSAAVLVRAGSSLAGYADQIAERMKMSRLFVGTMMLALATSLPELVTDITAARAGAPDLAVGDLFGSSMANMAILAIIDLLYRGKVWPSVELGHARVAAVAIALTAMAALSIFAQGTLRIGWVGLVPVLIVVIYVLSIAWFRRMPLLARPGLESPRIPLHKPTGWSERAAQMSLGGLWARFGTSALLILLTAPIVTLSVKAIADSTGIAQTFLGVALLAVTTSLPELVASIASVRIGAYDMAVGNLFGSNVANMSVLLFADIAYTDGAPSSSCRSRSPPSWANRNECAYGDSSLTRSCS
ncbi:MAG: sodium:calcium antiporter [Deltaproteobacteria bacterium]|nr:sodium:calcium antiporter [Deltaproteobacteria bacterium]